MNRETMEKVKGLLESKDQSMIEAIDKIEKPEELVEYLRSQNIDISLDDIVVKETGDGEISDDDLEAVNGGLKIRIPFTKITIGFGFFGGYGDALKDEEEPTIKLAFYNLGYKSGRRIIGK